MTMANIIRRNENVMPEVGWEPLRVMRDLIGWDPFAEMLPSLTRQMPVFAPMFEVKETKDAYVFKADMPRVREEDLDITLTGTRLTVSGKREAEERREDERFYAYERSYGSFTRSFTLPEGVNTESVDAALDNGVLTVHIARMPEHQPKKISLGRSLGDKIKGALGKGEKEKANA
jgi:HSP20 family protein